MKRIDWKTLNGAAQCRALRRPERVGDAQRTRDVARMIEQIRADGDSTVRALTRRFDEVEIGDLQVSAEEFAAARSTIGIELKSALEDAHARIEVFHRAGMASDYAVETAPGVHCASLVRPIARVGLYVPAGSAPLPSTALMLGVPSALAGCGQRILCTPPRKDGSVDPLTLCAAEMCGIRKVFRIGGVQAIAAMALGTESVPACDKLFGPGNAWVTEAKQQVQASRAGVSIDMPAGPSEVMVIADSGARADWVAADLLAQAEHGPDSQVVLVTDSVELLNDVERSVALQLLALPRRVIAEAALQYARLIHVRDIAQALEVCNRYAPEHLLLQCADAHSMLAEVQNAGSVFVGNWTPESIGDYSSGTNHVLPTDGWARSLGGLSVASFQKRITVQTATREGLSQLAPTVLALAQAEGLMGHARAVSIRLETAAVMA